jgi:hypothetical protein
VSGTGIDPEGGEELFEPDWKASCFISANNLCAIQLGLISGTEESVKQCFKNFSRINNV